jgi:UDP-glucuronate 4-epimerase
MKILLTGIAGFIGFHVAKKLNDLNCEVIGIDNINDYYDINLKYNRLIQLGIEKNKIRENKKVTSSTSRNLSFIKADLLDESAIINLFKAEQFDVAVNLAAQAGVRYSIENPKAYVDSNILGFFNLLENCRNYKIKHFVFASSSSVYGLNETMPFSVHHNVDHPISLYAASKKANELMAHTYSHLYKLPITGLRFFTVYGPWGRPDMALFTFTKRITENKTIDIYNNGNMKRDFTYIDDIVEGIIRVIQTAPKGNNKWSGKNPDPGSSKAPYKIYNIGNNSPINLMDFVKAIENSVGKKAKINFMPIQPGDVPATYADVQDLIDDFDYKPNTPIQIGINNFVSWYREFYNC